MCGYNIFDNNDNDNLIPTPSTINNNNTKKKKKNQAIYESLHVQQTSYSFVIPQVEFYVPYELDVYEV